MKLIAFNWLSNILRYSRYSAPGKINIGNGDWHEEEGEELLSNGVLNFQERERRTALVEKKFRCLKYLIAAICVSGIAISISLSIVIDHRPDWKMTTSDNPLSFHRLQVHPPPKRIKPGLTNSFIVRLVDDDGVLAAPRNETEPTLIALIQGPERLVLDLNSAQHLSYGTWEFHFRLFTPGMYQITVFFEGDVEWYNSIEAEWKAYHPPNDRCPNAYDCSPGLSRAADFNVSISKPLLAKNNYLDQHLALLPRCRGEDMPGMSGRWMLASAIPERYQQLIVPPSTSWSGDRFFLPDQCYFPYRAAEETSQCLSNLQISFLGDSLIEELATDLACHMLKLDERPDMSAYLGNSRTCLADNEKYRMFHWPINSTKLTMSWLPHEHVCANHQGVLAFEKRGVPERLRFALSNPPSVKDLSIYSWETPDPKDLKPNKANHVLIMDEALHSIAAMYETQLTLREYERRLSEIMAYVRPFVDTAIFHLSNPKMPQANHVVRQVNQVAMNLARQHNFLVLNSFAPLQARFDQDTVTLAGDYDLNSSDHHASLIIYNGQRSAWLHANTQQLINTICTRQHAPS